MVIEDFIFVIYFTLDCFIRKGRIFYWLYTYFLSAQKVPKNSAHGRFLNAKRS